jgi:FtsP/CotA-like multicopper oxidase with cupredoxin domain
MPLARYPLSRRHALGLLAGTVASGVLPPRLHAEEGIRRTLRATAGQVQLVGSRYPATEAWSYDGSIPGPILRARQGTHLDVDLLNDLPQPSTIHWHGLRLPNAMDGVPDVTQAPVGPGERFRYAFELKDAGTFWYHPHANSSEQVGRGLSGALIVEEAEPPQVDREELWVLDDWRLGEDAQILPFDGNLHDAAHAGRIGNTVTLNGILPAAWPVRSGERVRLRLVNVANARVFGLRFEGHSPVVIATDGQPCTPHAPAGGTVTLSPGGRCDLILDMAGTPGARFRLLDAHYRRSAYKLLEIAYADAPPLRSDPLAAPIALPKNPVPTPDLAAAEGLELLLAGGAMGGLATATLGDQRLGLRDLAERGKVWALNGRVHGGHKDPPLFRLTRGQTYRLRITNDSSFEHPMHLHGHHLLLLRRNGQPVTPRTWHDTLLVAPGETVETALVAESPGLWMIHCHVLEHQMAGMMATTKIA